MGNYKELILKVDLKEDDLPDNVINVLQYLFTNDKTEIDIKDLPDHELFKLDSWRSKWKLVGSGTSAYHPGGVYNELIYAFGKPTSLFTKFDMRAESDTIEFFLDWLKPYIETYGEIKCIGWIWFNDQDNEPSLLYFYENRYLLKLVKLHDYVECIIREELI